MTNSKTTKRALFSSAISLLLCFTMLMGATFAWFTDNVSSTGNRIQAGTLEVDLVMDKTKDNNYVSIADGKGDIFSEATGNGINWEPGKTEIVYLGVRNNGSLALKYNIMLDIADGNPGLVGSLEYAILDGKKAADLKDVEDWATIKAQAKVADVEAGQFVAAPNGVLDEIVKGVPEETDYFALAVHMKEDAGNEYQKGSITIDVKVLATQKDAEFDSFGNDYDADAPKVTVTPETAQATIHEAQPGDIIVLDTGIYGDLAIENADGTPKDGITIEGKGGNSSFCTVSSINLNSSSNITLKDVRFEITGAKPVYGKNGTASGYVSSIIGAKNGANTGAKNIVIDNCSFKTSNSYDASTYVPISFEEQGRPTSRATNITIRNCKTDPMKNMFNFARLNYVEGTITIENNSLLATAQHNTFNFTGNSADLIIKDNTIGHNSAFSSYDGWNPAKAAIGTSRKGTHLINIEITGNTFVMKNALVDNEGLVIDIKTNSYTADNCTVNFSGNTFEGSLAGMTEATVPCVMPKK